MGIETKTETGDSVSEFIASYAVLISGIWIGSFVLTILHSAFNEDTYQVRDLFFSVVFGPLYTLVRYSDWNAVIIRWPRREKK